MEGDPVSLVGAGGSGWDDTSCEQCAGLCEGGGRVCAPYQNHPYPLSLTMMISNALSMDSWVTREVDNVIGQRVVSLRD